MRKSSREYWSCHFRRSLSFGRGGIWLDSNVSDQNSFMDWIGIYIYITIFSICERIHYLSLRRYRNQDPLLFLFLRSRLDVTTIFIDCFVAMKLISFVFFHRIYIWCSYEYETDFDKRVRLNSLSRIEICRVQLVGDVSVLTLRRVR